MGTTTVESDGTRCFPIMVGRDTNMIPYVLVLDNTTLKVYKGDATVPTGWSSATVGDGNVATEAIHYASMAIYTYSGTEYIAVVRINDSYELVLDRSTVGAFAFPGGSTIMIDDNDNTYFPSIDYGENRLVIHYRYGSDEIANLQHSTDGGATWSGAVETWDEPSGTTVFRSTGVVWNGSHWHLLMVMNETIYTKRWSSGGGVEYWDGDSWESAGDGDDGLNTGYNNSKYGGAHGAASANIIVFSHMADAANYGRCIFSLDDGESWAETPNMDHNDYIGYPSFCLKTEAGEVDDIMVFASNYGSDQNDTNKNVYDYSGSSWSGWSLIWDSGDADDQIVYFAGSVKQQSGWVDFAYQHFDDSGSVYNVVFNQYEEGTVPSAGGELQLLVDGGVIQLLVDGGTIKKIVD